MTKKEELLLLRIDEDMHKIKTLMRNLEESQHKLSEFLHQPEEFRERIGNRQVCQKCLYTESKPELLTKCPECGSIIEDEYTKMQKRWAVV